MSQRLWLISKYGATPDQGGAQRQFSLARNFSKEFETTLIISRSNGISKAPIIKKFHKIEFYDKLKVVTINGPLISLGFNYKRVASWLIFEINLIRFALTVKKNQRPDIIVVSSLSLLTFISGIIFKKRFKSKLIVEVRDIWPLTLTTSGNFSKNNLIIKFLAKIEQAGYKYSDGIVGSMPRLDLHIKEVINKSFKFKCIPMGFSDEQYSYQINTINDETKNRYKLPNNKFIIAYAGAIGKLNIIDEIVSAAEILKDNNQAYFAVFGDGPMKHELETQSSQLENIKFYGHVSKMDIIPILKKCDLLIMPINNSPVYDYGVSPNKWIDYMMSGRPMLIAYSGFKSIINEAGCGFFVEANNPQLMAKRIISIMSEDSRVLDQMGEKGYNYVIENHSYKKLADDYKEFIQSL